MQEDSMKNLWDELQHLKQATAKCTSFIKKGKRKSRASAPCSPYIYHDIILILKKEKEAFLL